MSIARNPLKLNILLWDIKSSLWIPVSKTKFNIIGMAEMIIATVRKEKKTIINLKFTFVFLNIKDSGIMLHNAM